MSDLSDKLVNKLRKVAEVVDAEKQLYFFGLVHHELLPPGRWDVLVSAKGLVPWSINAIEYVVGLLRRELTDAEMIKISQVVALPRNNELVASLARNAHPPFESVRGLHPLDRPDDAVVIWPAKDSLRPAKVG